ncbi:MAG: hypothetical protein FWH25_02505, partial [Syntrophorhabdaceae bacterium]|nr:hypothetical protein [Syntrophorhabdaceae bacterium]
LHAERVFEINGKTYIVTTGRMSEAVRSVLGDSGYTTFSVMQNESGRSIFERLVRIAGGIIEPQKANVIAGGTEEGYEVLINGSRVLLPQGTPKSDRKIFLVKEKAHSATRTLLEDLGVEIVEWDP